ncbi:MAG: galactokinase [Acaryochloridaceae cyanobacterium RU_4_10]|nr:galactokinase [Acaryochloridaceae cyanobacterium RU_4_10]
MTPTFQDLFHQAPAIEAQAPGRVNLLGEHTDYNDGFVLPTVIPQTTTVQLGPSDDSQHHFYSASLNESVNLSPTTNPSEGFGRYVIGCLRLIEQRGIQIPPLNIWIASSIPIGAGLSSSAALEIAVLRGLRSLLALDFNDVDLAQIAQQAEHQYAGVKCGIMDQMAVSLADAQHLLFLDTRTLQHQRIPIPTGAEILVLDSGISRALAGSGYNQRRSECEAASQRLGLTALRDLTNPAQLDSLPPLLQRRARHGFTENQRVLVAKRGLSAVEFGQLMNASHTSLRDDYEVSVAGLDCLVDLLQHTPGVFGARLTGAGFGGACVALVAAGEAQAIATSVLNQYEQQGFQGQLLVPPTSA